MNHSVNWLTRLRKIIFISILLGLNSTIFAQDNLPQNGQPASDVLMSYDLWDNPTPVGGVTNGGTTSHSTW